jgi:hypothetical protein
MGNQRNMFDKKIEKVVHRQWHYVIKFRNILLSVVVAKITLPSGLGHLGWGQYRKVII